MGMDDILLYIFKELIGLTKLALRRGDLGPEKLIGERVFSRVGFWRSTGLPGESAETPYPKPLSSRC